MGGEGSGRKPDPMKVFMTQSTQPINPQVCNAMILPNLSGVKKGMKKTDDEAYLKLDQTTPQEIVVANIPTELNKCMWFFEDVIVPSGGDAGKSRPVLTPKRFANGDSGSYTNIGFLKGGMFLIPSDDTTSSYFVLTSDVAYSKSWGMYAFGTVTGKENMLEIYPAGSLTAPMMAMHGAADSSMAASFFYAGNASPLTTHVGNICPSTGAVRIVGTSAQSINMGSPVNAKTNGNNLTIFSGSAYATGATDKNAGDMIVSSGSSSGTGTGRILFNTATAGTTGTTLRTPTTKWIIDGAGNFCNSSDTYKIILGAGDDMSIIYDGTKGIIDTSLVTASDLQISCGTDKTIVLNESVWDDMQFLISGGKIPPSSYPDWDTSFTTNTGEYKFDVNDYIDLAANEMPHTYKQGTAIKPHLHLALDGANSSGSDQYAKFTLYIAYADANEVWTETSKTAEITIPTGTADLTHLFLDMGDLTFTNQLIGCQIKLRLKRIAATGGTEYPNHIFVTQVGIHHEIDTMGSRGVATK